MRKALERMRATASVCGWHKLPEGSLEREAYKAADIALTEPKLSPKAPAKKSKSKKS